MHHLVSMQQRSQHSLSVEPHNKYTAAGSQCKGSVSSNMNEKEAFDET